MSTDPAKPANPPANPPAAPATPPAAPAAPANPAPAPAADDKGPAPPADAPVNKERVKNAAEVEAAKVAEEKSAAEKKKAEQEAAAKEREADAKKKAAELKVAQEKKDADDKKASEEKQAAAKKASAKRKKFIDNRVLNLCETYPTEKLAAVVSALSEKAGELGLSEDDCKVAASDSKREVEKPITVNVRSYANAVRQLGEDDKEIVGTAIALLQARHVEIEIPKAEETAATE